MDIVGKHLLTKIPHSEKSHSLSCAPGYLSLPVLFRLMTDLRLEDSLPRASGSEAPFPGDTNVFAFFSSEEAHDTPARSARAGSPPPGLVFGWCCHQGFSSNVPAPRGPWAQTHRPPLPRGRSPPPEPVRPGGRRASQSPAPLGRAAPTSGRKPGPPAASDRAAFLKRRRVRGRRGRRPREDPNGVGEGCSGSQRQFLENLYRHEHACAPPQKNSSPTWLFLPRASVLRGLSARPLVRRPGCGANLGPFPPFAQ